MSGKSIWYVFLILLTIGSVTILVDPESEIGSRIFSIVLLVALITFFVVKQRVSFPEVHPPTYGKPISEVDRMSGYEFERYVGKLLRNQGFAVEQTPYSRDYGADLIARRDGKRYAVQVKRYSIDRRVPFRAVSQAVASVPYYDCDEAMLVTNSHFTPHGIAYARKVGCRLVQRGELLIWIQGYNSTLEVKNKRFDVDNTKQYDAPKRVSKRPDPIVEADVLFPEDANLDLRPWTPDDVDGFVVNTTKNLSHKSTRLHKASCHLISNRNSEQGKTTVSRFKIWSSSDENLDLWGRRHLNGSPQRCSSCLGDRNKVTTYELDNPKT